MHLTIISGSPRVKKYSNTNKIIAAFKRGVEQAGSTASIYYLTERKSWEAIRQAFYESQFVLFAFPLFVESLPGIMLEFLEEIDPKQYQGKIKLAFLVHGGFEEASQLRCCEEYLEVLPGMLQCEYAGTLLKGGTFMLRITPEKAHQTLEKAFEQMGESFARKQKFEKAEVTEFAKPEYYSSAKCKMYNLMMPMEKIMFDRIAKSQFGCTEPLDARPYEGDRSK